MRGGLSMIDRMRRVGLVTLLAAGLLVTNAPAIGVVPAGAGSCLSEAGPVGETFDDCSGGQVFNLVPPGQAGTYNLADFSRAQAGQGFPPHTRDQEPLYADLLAVAPNLKAPDIGTFYKDASFLADLSQAERVETFPLRPGTVIIRDKQFGVPHIFGTTRADTEFGAGFASAEDRLFEMDVLRHVGPAQLTALVGPSPAYTALDCSLAAVAGHSPSELQQQVDNFAAQHPDPIVIDGVQTTEGQQIADDAQAFVDGVNEYITEAQADPSKMPAEYTLLQVPLQPWNPTATAPTPTIAQAISPI